MRWHHVAFKYAGRVLMVGGALTSIVLLAFQSFRTSALLVAAELLVLFLWRVQEPDGSGAWYAVRKKWIDLVTVGGLLVGVILFAIWVPEPLN